VALVAVWRPRPLLPSLLLLRGMQEPRDRVVPLFVLREALLSDIKESGFACRASPGPLETRLLSFARTNRDGTSDAMGRTAYLKGFGAMYGTRRKTS